MPQGTFAGWVARVPLAMLGLCLVGVVLGLGAPAAHAEVFQCTPMSSETCKQLQPVAECVWDNGDGTRTAVWGWNNPTTDSAYIPVSNKNNMSPGSADQGQPTLFGPGRQRNVFVTTFSGTTSIWHLGNNDATVSTGTATCASKPVPQIGSIGALLLGLFAVAISGLFFVCARSVSRAVTA